MRARSFWESLGFALRGLGYALITQRNMRIHAAIALAATLLAAFLGFDPIRWALLGLTIGLVWAAELLNTALEAVVDLARPDPHPLARTAKDVAAAMVLVCALTAVGVGLALFGPPLWNALTRLGGAR
ncbi:MAG: diacylglycerol kinase [Thermoflexus sp.]|uniref:diacylglycerol kinase family protein n=1 Tax=Thermoflexus sp. TaxID=1969742 RepID=UPI00332E581F